MTTRIIFILLVLFVGCNQNGEEIGDGLVGIVTYEYSSDNHIEYVQEFHSAYLDNVWQSSYYQFVVRKYDSNDNMLEQITYDIDGIDTVFHDIISQKFDEQNRLIEKVDSMKMMKIKESNHYTNNQLLKSTTHIVYSQRDSLAKNLWTPIDSSVTENISIFIDNNYSYSQVISWDSHLAKEKEEHISDTFHLYEFFGESSNIINSISIYKADTFKIESNIYDDNGNVLVNKIKGRDEIVNGSTYYDYDIAGNITQQIDSNFFFTQKTMTTYSDQNKPTKMKWIKLK